MNFKYLLLFFTIVLNHISLKSQNQNTPAFDSDPTYNLVWSMVVDAHGTKWFGTLNGVTTYDGRNWVTYNVSNSGLISNSVRAIAIDLHNNKWLGTDYGVSKYDGQTWTSFNRSHGLADDHVNCITLDAHGNVWIGTQGGVSKFDGSSWKTYTTDNGLANNIVRSIAIDKQGRKWFGTQNGISRFSDSTWTTYTNTKGSSNCAIESIVIDSAGKIWVGTKGGVYSLEDSSRVDCTFNSYLKAKMEESKLIVSENHKSKKSINHKDLIKFDGAIRTYFTTINGVAISNISSISFDADEMFNSVENNNASESSNFVNNSVNQLGDIKKIQSFLNVTDDIVYIKTALDNRIITIYNAAGKMLFLKQMNNEQILADLSDGYYEISFRNKDGESKIVNSLSFR